MSTSPRPRSVLARRPVVAWAFYGCGNSAFATTVMAGFFPVFFKQYWNAGVEMTECSFRLGLTNGIAALVIASLAPVLGAIADRSSSRVRMLMMVTVLGCAATAGLALVGQGHWVAASVLYFVASLGFWGGIVFNDSRLLHVAEPEEYDLVSGYGYALGYLGGGLLFAVNVLMTLKPHLFGLADASQAVRVSFVMVGAWWFACSQYPALQRSWRDESGAAVGNHDGSGASLDDVSDDRGRGSGRQDVRCAHGLRSGAASKIHPDTC